MSSPITTHVLDTATGQPAVGIAIRLERRDGTKWAQIGSGVTNNNGRVIDLMKTDSIEEAHYRMSFETAPYFADHGIRGFYPVIRIEFEIVDSTEHYHIPLLLSPFGYSTYRGS